MKRTNKWYPWITTVGLFCLLAFAGLVYKADQDPAAQKQSAATFNFDRYTGKKPFKLNTLPTTKYGPPWADVTDHPANFLECEGAAIALCYYSGPGPTAPCNEDGLGLANCTCYEIPKGHPYLVDINSILNLDVYLKTVAECGKHGEKCLPVGSKTAPVCGAINNNTLIPGADLISTFSLYLEKESKKYPQFALAFPPTSCTTSPYSTYAGCMTAPCKRTGKTDATTGLPLVQCGCPTYTGPFQVGTAAAECVLDGTYIWSAAYNTIQPPTPR